MDIINDIISVYSNYFIFALAVISFILLIIVFTNTLSINSLKKKYKNISNGVEGLNIEEILTDYYRNVEQAISDNRDIKDEVKNIKNNLVHCAQKVGIVRFSAFENVGSDLSFAIAILDANDDGIVLNGIYSRDSSSVYAKPIIGGKSKYALSKEEQQAINLAQKNHCERVFALK